MFDVKVHKNAIKNIEKAPKKVQELFVKLIDDLRKNGEVQPKWKNFSKLSENNYHCHLTYSYVACWSCENNAIKIEVYYAGSRESAPY
ncbi:MAG: hypothetical protein ACTTJ7_08495 [Treponema sp.]